MSVRPPVPSLRLPQTDRPYHWAVTISVLFHAVLIAFFVVRQASDVAETSRAPGAPGRRGGGGEATRFIRLDLPVFQRVEKAVPPPVRAVEVPPPPLQPIPLKVQKLNLPLPTGTVLSRVDVAAGAGPGRGPGVGAGVGSGVGVDSGSAAGGKEGDVFPPTMRYTILPPLPLPASVRGRSYSVHFWVDARGEVTRVRMDPEIKDAAYRQEFLAMLREYTFEPARKLDGTKVDGEITVKVTL